MKYKTEVDSEKRNKSPRNDLLRNRKCVGIIHAAEAHTHTHTGTFPDLERRQTSCDVSRCQKYGTLVRGQSGFNEARRRRVVSLRQRRGHRRLGSRVYFRGGSEHRKAAIFNQDIHEPYPERVLSA